MNWLQWLMVIFSAASIAAVVTVFVDAIRFRVRCRRMAAKEFARVNAACGNEKQHTGGGVSGGNASGSGVTAAPLANPRRCARCHFFHLNPQSLLCEACHEEMRKGGAA